MSQPSAGRATWHTHTYRCKHASGDVADYAREAVRAGLAVMGMSDHSPLPHDTWPDYRMAQSELEGYVAAVRQAQVDFPTLRIPLGLEVDWLPEHAAWWRDQRPRFDYLVAGAHATPFAGDWIDSFNDLDSPARIAAYADYVVTLMETGLFSAITHPDVYGACAAAWTHAHAVAARRIAEASRATGVALELNGYGLRKPPVHGRPPYPWPPFWDICAEVGVPVIVCSDAHRPQDVAAGLEELHARRQALGLTEISLA